MTAFLEHFAALLLAGCASVPSGSDLPRSDFSYSASSQSEQPASEAVILPLEEPDAEDSPPEPLGIGTVGFADPGEMTLGQQEIVLALMTRYYDTLAGLELQKPDDLFTPGADAQRLGNRAIWEYIVEIRKMQRADLSLLSYQVELTCRNLEEGEDGSVTLWVSEDSIQNFRATPEVDSEQKNVYHQFTLTSLGEDRWTVTAHSQMERLYWTVMGRYAYRRSSPSTPSLTELEAYYKEQTARMLEAAREDVARRLSQGEEKAVAASHPYDRERAVAYARQWVGDRSSSWPDYSRNGGNCQNFVSQCLLVGGIPMDISAPGIWKWYGSTPDNLPRAAGRSASWSAVEDFLSYTKENRGYGLAAVADAPYDTGRPGDIIHMGTADRWRHAVLISDVVTDEEGNIVDYLICSNPADLRDFPVSAYTYTRQLLIRVEGWNG